MTIAVVALQSRHLDAIMAIEHASFATPWSREAFEREIDGNRCAYYLVLTEDGVPVGYAGCWLVLDEGHITNIAIAPNKRGMGYGERLTRALMEGAAAKGTGYMTLEVRRSNAAAIALYEKLGFFKVGVRKGYYENGEDAHIMLCETMPEVEPIYDIIEET